MKKYLIIILMIFSFNFSQSEMTKYNFNFGSIQLEDCTLEHKRSGRRKFSGTIENRKPSNLEWIKLEFYFKDNNFNHGREVLVSSEYIRNIPKKSHKYFKLSLPLGNIDGRNFRVKLVDYKISDSI